MRGRFRLAAGRRQSFSYVDTDKASATFLGYRQKVWLRSGVRDVTRVVTLLAKRVTRAPRMYMGDVHKRQNEMRIRSHENTVGPTHSLVCTLR